jgi:hypothetical protein
MCDIGGNVAITEGNRVTTSRKQGKKLLYPSPFVTVGQNLVFDLVIDTFLVCWLLVNYY